MTDNRQPEALRLANEFKLCNEYDSIPSINDIAKAEAELRLQHARIAELEAQLESIGAGGVSGPLMGCASIAASAGSEPVAWLVCSVNSDGTLSLEHAAAWQEAAHEHINDAITEHGIDEAASWVVRPAYTHPSPTEGMAGGWTKASQQLPPCRDDQLYIGINTAGFAGVFNVVRVIHGNTYCLMEVAEESVSIMSDLDIWQPFAPPTTSASSGKGE